MKKLIDGSVAIFLLVGVGCSSIQYKTFPKNDPAREIKARVVIDAGHGGEDSGAVSKRGLLEKDVTLDIARRLGRLFKKMMPKVEVVFTRSSDRYVSLEDRVKRANDKSGALLISLHVNSSENKEAQGFELFSLDVASDRHAERLAARENKVLGQNASELQFILADLRANSNRQQSDRLALAISAGLRHQLWKLKSAIPIQDRGYSQAIFHVLFANMPGILLELFFLSNEKEEKMLSEPASRELIARGIFLGGRKFLLATTQAQHASK
ncbi:MAG TPA: N-acetylmuramoyl-L-alanine amidase [Myxococcota bacterium]|nr:N-acetylmuramoyl-L-alanine amidase [Myxococcota bacterium]